MSVTRYKVEELECCFQADMIESPTGEYVLHSDYARLLAEVDALKLGSLLTAVDVLAFINLKAEVERLRASSFVTAVPVEEYEKLKAEVERLRKAGDAMASALILFEMKSEEERQDRIKAWSD